ncbi:MAG TPA: PHP domain-containing protein [Nitrososphaeraceae archaeon]|nr:PHP domain-containing protein [Nitrososphaeraceae archaeon]
MNIKEDYHVHCNYNDHSSPDLTIRNVLRRAKEINLEVLAITEHVRKTSDWIPKYLKEIDSQTKKYAENHDSNLRVISGFEAKILADGSVNCPEEYSKNYFLIASFHNIFGNKEIWINALKKAIENPDVDVIGHIAPEPTFTLENDEINALASLIVKNKKIVEINAKYRRPPPNWILTFSKRGVKFHLGSDAHSLQQIGQFEKISDLISLVDGSSVSSTIYS